jgi:regulator of protease activity HflC (stomatin/prohibitin superfamily)
MTAASFAPSAQPANPQPATRPTAMILAVLAEFGTIVAIGLVLFLILAILKTATIVPQRSAYVVERLGKYSRTLDAGFHLLMPFLDRVAYKHSLKEVAIDVPSQMCITKDNIAIEIDGVLYMQVLDPVRASYGIQNYTYAATQLAQTTLRSEIGKLELDKTFEERDTVNANIIEALDKASEPWGLKITRYEIANITPPPSVQDALEKQMRAERERRAQIARSEGEREAVINVAEGNKQEVIKQSEAQKLRQINEAEGKAQEIELIATATAEGIRRIAESIHAPGGSEAVSLRIAEQYIREFGNIAKVGNTLILPANLSDIGGAVAGLAKVLDHGTRNPPPPPPPAEPPPVPRH